MCPNSIILFFELCDSENILMFNDKILTCGVVLESNRHGTVIYLITSQLSTDCRHFDAFGVLYLLCYWCFDI